MSPIYEYECECGVIEITQSSKDKPITVCPRCCKSGLKRVISICSSHFKGKDWTPKFHNKDGKNNKVSKRKKETK